MYTDNTDSDTNRHVLTLTILIVTLIDMCVDTDNTDSDTNRHVLTLTILIVTLIDMC